MATLDRDPLTSPWLRIFAFVLVLLYPSKIAEELQDLEPEAPLAKSLPHEPRGKTQSSRPLKLAPVSGLDRDAFLAAFKRQVDEPLMACLRAALGTHGRLTLLARLSREGKLTTARILDPASLKLSCVQDALEKMEFRVAGRSLRDESIEVQWRFDF